MATKKLYEIGADEQVSRPADFALTNGVPAEQYVSNLFTSANTSTDPQPSGALYNAILDKGIVKVVQTICASLDPDNSSIADIIKALKGIN